MQSLAGTILAYLLAASRLKDRQPILSWASISATIPEPPTNQRRPLSMAALSRGEAGDAISQFTPSFQARPSLVLLVLSLLHSGVHAHLHSPLLVDYSHTAPFTHLLAS